jgi:hypothetical protein
MSLNLIAVHDQITAKLRELPQDVYETSAPDDSKLRFDANGRLLPYIVVQYSDMYPTGTGNGITGAKYDAAQSYALVSCISENERASRQVADAVKNKIVGFQATDAGEIRFEGGAITYATPDGKAKRYVVETGFLFQVNTVW